MYSRAAGPRWTSPRGGRRRAPAGATAREAGYTYVCMYYVYIYIYIYTY